MVAPIWTKMVDADIITMIPMMSKKMPMAFMVNFLISREQKQLLQRRRGARQRAPFSGQVIADTGRSLFAPGRQIAANSCQIVPAGRATLQA
jgi:hypothetical protein